jgi:hypothetical protein
MEDDRDLSQCIFWVSTVVTIMTDGCIVGGMPGFAEIRLGDVFTVCYRTEKTVNVDRRASQYQRIEVRSIRLHVRKITVGGYDLSLLDEHLGTVAAEVHMTGVGGDQIRAGDTLALR